MVRPVGVRNNRFQPWELERLGKLVETASRRKSASSFLKTRTRRRKPNRTGWARVKSKRFDAFTKKSTKITPKGKTLVSTEAQEPTSGIHSRVWAEQILPQTGLLSLPVEIRHRIYEELLSKAIIKDPRRRGTKFATNKKDLATFKIYHILALVCRQTYVDVVGGGLLHSFANFSFSTGSMLRYFSCINPAHKEAIRNITLSVSFTNSSPAIPQFVFDTLASLPKLSSLEIKVVFAQTLCTNRFGHRNVYGASPRVAPLILSKLQERTQWEAIKGITEFKMSFEVSASKEQKRYGRHWDLSLEDLFCTSQDLNFETIIATATKIVTQKRAE